MSDVLNKIGVLGVVPVISIEHASDAVPLGEVLIAENLPCIEVTFRTAAAEEAISHLADTFPDLLIGAGTVLTVDQAQRAVDAGALFIVAPGFDPPIVDWCLEKNIVVIPGVATPTEITTAMSRELQILKFFPAEAFGGVSLLKAIAGPYKDVKFIPTGGINESNLDQYLRLPMVHACGGSWMAKSSLISEGKFDQIARQVREAIEIVQQARNQET